MKTLYRVAVILVGILLFLTLALSVVFPPERLKNDPDFPELTAPYLGQEPPGHSAKRFAPGIIHEDAHTAAVFSPDGQEVYWRVMDEDISDEILFMRFEQAKWTPPQVVPFASRFFDSDDPCFSPDGKKLYFTSWRPIKWFTVYDLKERIWFVERTAQGWSKPKPVGSAINTMDLHWQFSVAENGSLYFTSDGDIYHSPFADDEYLEPRRLGHTINTPSAEGLPFIAPDESYLLFSSNGHPDQVGDFDLYVSERKTDGSWAQAINLGESVNSRYQELYPVVSPEEKYLFFLSNRGGSHSVYWVDFASVMSRVSARAEGN